MSYMRDTERAGESLLTLNAGHWVLTNLANSDNVLTYTFPAGRYRYEVMSLKANVTVAVTTGSKAATATVKRTRGGSTTSTGVVLAMTSAALTPEGAQQSSTSTGDSASKEFIAGDVLTVPISSVTQFSEGQVTLNVTLRRKPF